MPPKSIPAHKFNTLTTAGRLAKAAHKHEQAMAESAPSSAPPPKKKPRKTTTLPPPCEIEADAALREEAKKAKKKPKKPLTTKDKLTAANAVKARKEQAGKKTAANAGKGAKGNVKGEKPKNLMDIMRELGQMGSKVKAPAVGKAAANRQTATSKIRDGAGKGKAKVKESVLVRPTEKTKRMVAKQSQQPPQSSVVSPSARLEVVEIEDDAIPQPHTSSRLMDLPPELRQRIWHFAVVETDFFVYPALDREQPDLAMASRQIRSEVLPIFYGENVFAIEITGYGSWGGAKKGKKHSAPSLKLIEKWVVAMATANHAEMISRWAIVWREPQVPFSKTTLKAEDRDIIVSIRYPKPTAVGVQDLRPAVEIHRHAFCLLEGNESFAPCVLHCYPGWLDSLIEAAERAGKGHRGRQMMEIASDMTPGGGSLLFSRCEEEVAEPE